MTSHSASDELLAERGKTHGDWPAQANTARQIKRAAERWIDEQREQGNG